MVMALEQVMLTPCKSEQELLEHFGCYGFEKQSNFYQIIGDNDWQIDINQGVIHFGNNITFSIQLLGSFSLSSETWLWSWNNDTSQLPSSVIEQALSLKQYGEQNGIDLFTVGQFAATQEDLYKIGVIAAGMLNTDGYYLADFGEGIVLVTVKKARIDVKNNTQSGLFKILPKFIGGLFNSSSSQGSDISYTDQQKQNQTDIFANFSEFISNFDVNHYRALKYYLIAKDYQIDTDDLNTHSQLTASKGEQKIVAKFDEHSRITSLNG